MAPVLSYFRSQWLLTLPYPTHDFTGQTIIITGSNTGLGLEAARHIVRLGAKRVILAVRSLDRGKTAAKSIGETTGRADAVEVWELDLASYTSVRAFASRATEELDRLDGVVENAAVITRTFTLAEGNEKTVTVNFISTMLLGLLLLPKLRETSVKYKTEVVLTFVGSFVHWLTSFPEGKAENILEELANEKRARMADRYQVTKLMELLAVREFAAKISQSNKAGTIVVSIINPGSVKSDINREATGSHFLYVSLLRILLMRSTEEGSRTLVHGAQGGKESHGQYLNDCIPDEDKVSGFVRSPEGVKIQKKLWNELTEKLESIQSGIMNII